jgi:hypothetical protein
MSDELLPCPFCGTIPKLEEDRDTGPGIWFRPKPWPAENMVCRISCCNVRIYKSATVFNNDEAKAREFAAELATWEWNKRAPVIDAKVKGIK